MFDLLAVLNLLGVIQGFFLASVFLFSDQNHLSNRLLGGLLLVLSLTIFEIFACYTNLIVWFPFFINITEPFDFLIGPLVFFYTLSLTRPGFVLKNKWLHFVPAIIFFVLRLPFLLQSNAFKLADVQEVYHRATGNPVAVQPLWWFPKYHFGGFWMDLSSFPHQGTYLLLCLWLIFDFTRRRQETFFNSSQQAVRWLSRIMVLFGIFLVVAGWLSFTSADDLGDIYIATALSGVFYILSYYLLRHSSLLNRAEAEKKKYEKSGLNEALATDALHKLRHLMQTTKPYLNPDLTLPQLAADLRLSTHHLSQLLNEQAGKNFSDFLNEYRIEEVKQKLIDPALTHLKIEELAFASGFNSKSVFNTAFKKFTGTTPSAFRKLKG